MSALTSISVGVVMLAGSLAVAHRAYYKKQKLLKRDGASRPPMPVVPAPFYAANQSSPGSTFQRPMQPQQMAMAMPMQPQQMHMQMQMQMQMPPQMQQQQQQQQQRQQQQQQRQPQFHQQLLMQPYQQFQTGGPPRYFPQQATRSWSS